jgi:hypothetical protein
MLDDLDALMEQMLALPVSDSAESAPASRQGPRTGQESPPLPPTDPPESKKMPALTASLTPIEPTCSAPPAAAAMSHGAVEPMRPRRWREAVVAPSPAPAPPPTGLSPLLPGPLPPLVGPSSGEVVDAIPAPAATVALWWLRPLWWCNEAFDRCTVALGPRGQWLRARGGRTLLGCSGVALLLLALLLLINDWLGWTW